MSRLVAGALEALALGFVRLGSVLVPRAERGAWREEWEAEVWYRLHGEATGQSPVAAAGVCLRCFGAIWHGLWMRWQSWSLDAVIYEARHAARALARSLPYSVAVVGTLGLAIGASASVFSVAHAVLLKPLPFTEPDRLLRVQLVRLGEAGTVVEASYPDLVDWSREVTRFEGLAAFATTAGGMPVEVEGSLEEFRGELVSWNLFPLLGARTVLGRTFAPEEDRVGAPHTAVLGEDLWRDRFGADPAVIGTSLVIGDEQHEVIGVVSRDFEYPVGSELWIPVTPSVPEGFLDARSVGFLNIVGRLAPGVSRAEGLEELNAVVERVTNSQLPASMASTARLEDISVELVGDTERTLLVLLFATALLLLIACANVANLQVVRGVSRRSEQAVRAALGAGRGRLSAASFLESGLLAVLGGVLGVGLAAWAIPRLVSLSPVVFFRGDSVELNAPVVGFAAAITVLVLLLSGLTPAWLRRGGSAFDALRAGSTRGTGRGTRRWMRSVVVFQFALALVLVLGAGLLGRSFATLYRQDTGFDREAVLTLAVPLFDARYQETSAADRFFEDLVDGVRALPGVREAGAVLLRPLDSPNGYDVSFTIEGRPPEEQSSYPFLNLQAATPGYFEAMSIPVLEGRSIAEGDREDGPPVVFLSQGAASRYWPDGGTVGSRIKFGGPESENPWMEVAGVVGDVRYRTLEVARHDVYVPYRQSDLTLQHLVVRTDLDPESVTAAVQSVLSRLDPAVRPMDVATTGGLVRTALARPRFGVILIGILGSMALVLGAVGIYGVMSYSVRTRRHEVGVRLALGARPSSVTRLVVWEGLQLAAIGLVIGLAAAASISGLLRGLLYGVGATDPVTFVVGPVVLVGVAVLTCLVPARRAARTDPVEAFRSD